MTKRIEISTLLNKRTLALTFVLGAASFAFAQEKVNVTGTIVNKQNTAVPYASVTFSNKSNKLYSDAVLSDDKGAYQIALTPGNYAITVEAIDFKKITLNKQISSAGNLGIFTVEAENSITNTKTQDIQGVTITATTKPYRVEIDKKVYDPSTDLLSKGGNLQDVLSNVPSISVDTDGTVSMRGNTNIKFLINGKPSALLGIDDGADALKSIPADQIDRIEVITNPSSKYEASGTAGILNIILKKSKKLGFNGSVTGSVGYLPNTSLNTNLSWRKGNWTYFINGGGGYSESKSKSYQEYQSLLQPAQLGTNSTFYSTQNGESSGDGANYNVNSGFVVDITEKSSLNASVLFRNFNYNSTDTTTYFEQIVSSTNALVEENTVRINEGERKNNSFQADLGFDQKIGDNGQLLSVSTSYQNSKSDNTSVANENSTYTSLINNIVANSNNTTFLGKADYELPIGENSKFESGARFDFSKNKYNYFVNESENNSAFVTLPNFTSDTNYSEKITAAYAQFKSKIGAFGYQAGLRMENTGIDVNFKRITDAQEIAVTKNYTGLFPSIFLSYDLAKNNQLLLNFSRRIQRPRSFFLIPFMSYNNNRNLFTGNPDLNPTYENSFEMGYSLSSKKLTINPTLYYKKSEDEVNFYQYSGTNSDGSTVIFTMPVNAGSEQQYGLDLNATYDPVKWFRAMGSLDLFGYNNTGNFNGVSFDGDGFSTRLRLTTTFKPDKNTSFQVQGFYRGGEKTASNDRKSMYAINFGASKTIMKGDGTLAFNIQDIFNTRAREFTFSGANYTQYSYNQWQPRQFSLSFTYRFKSGDKVDQPKKKKDINSNNQDGDDQGPPM